MERISYLVAQPVAAILVLGLLFLYAAPRLNLEGGAPRPSRPSRRMRRSASAIVAGLLVIGGTALPLVALASPPAPGASVPVVAAVTAVDGLSVEISADLEFAEVTNGDDVEFSTTIVNTGDVATPGLVIAMNIINLGKGGDPVDPEDWSPERVQDIGALAPGESADQAWFVSAILDGDYMVYLTVVPEPSGSTSSSQPIASPGIHITVAGLARSNPGGVLPVAIGVPVLLIAVTVLLRRWWNRDRSVPRDRATTNGGGA